MLKKLETISLDSSSTGMNMLLATLDDLTWLKSDIIQPDFEWDKSDLTWVNFGLSWAKSDFS